MAKEDVVFVGSAEFLDKYREKAGDNGLEVGSKLASTEEIKSVFDTIHYFLKNGRAVNKQGFGKFELRHRAARVGRNPQTNEKMQLPASTTVGFKCGKDLRNDVAGK